MHAHSVRRGYLPGPAVFRSDLATRSHNAQETIGSRRHDMRGKPGISKPRQIKATPISKSSDKVSPKISDDSVIPTTGTPSMHTDTVTGDSRRVICSTIRKVSAVGALSQYQLAFFETAPR